MILFPRVVRLRHFVLLPALAMAALIALSRAAQAMLSPRLGPAGEEVFQATRTAAVALCMASLIGWLAVRYRRPWEIELRERNRELEQTRDFLSSIIRDSAEGIVTLDTDDRITSWNRAAERIFGWTVEEVRGMGVDRMLPDDPQVIEERRRIRERLRAGETVSNHETRRVRKDGKPITVRISWSPLRHASGNVAGSIGVVLDVTAQREMQERLVESERLAAVGEMAAHVAHEIRNPLAGIRAGCEVLFTRGDVAEEAREIGHEVVHQIDRLNQTVSELLQFAAPRKIETAPEDLKPLIDRVVSQFREHPASRGVSIERHALEELPRARVDKRQLEQVFYNLLLNAAQAMRHAGSITISAARDGGFVEIAVRDTGPGLPAEARDRLFQPFFTTRTEGTGLGLAIVKKIVSAHGGAVEASNRPAGGAEFRVRLPL
jgi:PAS domain S-box-containing protein